jgi:adenosylcobinamide-GDP ribazoletransferase
MVVLKRFREAVGFLSVLPVGAAGAAPAEEFARSAAFFPAVGLLIGAGCLAVTAVFDGLVGQGPANALVLLFLVLITGGLHIDALADTADGFAGSRPPERRLEIMRSGASGPIGVAIVTGVLLLKFSLLSGLGGGERAAALLLAPLLARWPMVVLAWALPPVRTEGLGRAFAGRIKIIDLAIATGFVVAAAAGTIYLWDYRYFALVPTLVLATVAVGTMSRRLLGGVTGDTLGATVELSEAALLGIFLVIK